MVCNVRNFSNNTSTTIHKIKKPSDPFGYYCKRFIQWSPFIMMSSFTKMFSRILNNRVFLLTLCNFSYRQCALKSALVTMLISLSPVSRLASRSCQIRWIRGWERLSTNTTIFPQSMFRSGMIKNFLSILRSCFTKKERRKYQVKPSFFVKNLLKLSLIFT